MSSYFITFTPAEPYFFGNEKSFRYPGQKNGGNYSNSYFIKSEDMPSQSTILGALRYILIPNKNFPEDETKRKQNTDAVGKESFKVNSTSKQSFGKIKSVSPAFIVSDDKILVHIPRDHNLSEDSKEYRPFSEYRDIETNNGTKKYAEDYDVKKGLSNDFLNIKNNEVIKMSDVIHSSVRVGINRNKEENGYFKKEYKKLENGYSFAVCAEIDSDLPKGLTKIVCLGQGKSPFSVKFRKDTNIIGQITEFISKKLGDNTIYCFGDAFVNNDPCIESVFAAFSTKDYRCFGTDDTGSVKKGGTLFRCLSAGSIFIADDPDEWILHQRNSNAHQIGYNYFIKSGGNK